jgi:hypothetical protein
LHLLAGSPFHLDCLAAVQAAILPGLARRLWMDVSQFMFFTLAAAVEASAAASIFLRFG